MIKVDFHNLSGRAADHYTPSFIWYLLLVAETVYAHQFPLRDIR
jgi:hypothetical protein